MKYCTPKFEWSTLFKMKVLLWRPLHLFRFRDCHAPYLLFTPFGNACYFQGYSGSATSGPPSGHSFLSPFVQAWQPSFETDFVMPSAGFLTLKVRWLAVHTSFTNDKSNMLPYLPPSQIVTTYCLGSAHFMNPILLHSISLCKHRKSISDSIDTLLKAGDLYTVRPSGVTWKAGPTYINAMQIPQASVSAANQRNLFEVVL